MTSGSTADERIDLLALCTESKRLARAQKDASKVAFAVDGPDLWIAAVSAYNVVLDLESRRIQHGCRDFQGQVLEQRLCKHVAALLLALDEDVALPILREMTRPASPWHLEVMSARGFGRQ